MDATITKINENILNPLILILFSLALLFFIVGLVRFVAQAGDDEGRSLAKKHILYGLLGMFIMFSAFSLIKVITKSLGINTAESTLNSIEK